MNAPSDVRSPVKRVKRAKSEALPLGAFLQEQRESGVLEEATLDALVVSTEATLPASLKERLLSSLDREHRFQSFEERVAELSDLPESVASVLLGRLDSKEHWAPVGAPGVEIFHFDGGPKVRDAITGFVRILPGSSFPVHEHMGHETVLVLQGTLRDDDGEEYSAGDEIEMDADSTHSFSAAGDVPLVLVTVVMKGVTIDGQFIPPGDPRA